MAYIVFDIETRVDKALLQRVFYPDMAPDLAYQKFLEDRAAQGKNNFAPLAFHIPVSIAAGFVAQDWTLTKVATLGNPTDHAQFGELFERSMVEHFWRFVDESKHTLVSWNGRAFDLPVLELAALRYGCSAGKYWNDKFGARYRYSTDGHYDVYDVLTNNGAVPIEGGLNAVGKLLGYAGKQGMDGSSVQAAWDAGEHAKIHAYCRQDVMLTYMIFLRLELVRGRLTLEQYNAAQEFIRARAEEWA